MRKNLKKNLPFLCLNAIVKNEAHIILKMLESVCPYIDYYVISDTGSTDGTQEVIKKFFQQKKIPGEIFNDPWYDDFGKNRTLAIEEARGKSQYLWVMDADDYLFGELPLTLIKQTHLDLYRLQIREAGAIFHTRVQIFRNFPKPQLPSDKNCYYVGVRHEALTTTGTNVTVGVLEGSYKTYYIQSTRLGNRSQCGVFLKYANDARVLENAIAQLDIDIEDDREKTKTEKEDDERKDLRWRYVYFAGQSYYDCQQYHKSLVYFQKYIQGVDFKKDLLVYEAYKYAGQIYEILDDKDKLEPLLLTMANLWGSHRMEPWGQLASFYSKTLNFEKMYECASRALPIPCPIDTTTFLILQKEWYDYKMLLLCAIAAHRTGRLREAYQYYKQLKTLDLTAHFTDQQHRDFRGNVNFLSLKIRDELSVAFKQQNRRQDQKKERKEEGEAENKTTENATESEFLFFPLRHSAPCTIALFAERPIDELKELCRSNPSYVAFRSNGEMKTALLPTTEWYTVNSLDNMMNIEDGLYVKRKYYDFLVLKEKEAKEQQQQPPLLFLTTELPAFCIALEPEEDERWEKMKLRASQFSLDHLQKWKASTPETAMQEGFQFRPNPALTNGARGCAVSHYKIWQHMVDQKIPAALILESDVAFRPDWLSVLDPFLSFLQTHDRDQWDAIFLNIWDDLRYRNKWLQIEQQYCTGAYILSLKGAQYLLQTFPPQQLECSDHMTLALQSRKKCYSLYPWLAIQDYQTGSMIQTPAKFEADKQKCEALLQAAHWEFSDYI